MKQKQQLVVLAVLLIIAAVVWSLYFRGEKQDLTSDSGLAMQNLPILGKPNPTPRTGEREAARKTQYKGSGIDLFTGRPIPPPIDPHPRPKTSDVVTPVVQVPQVSPLPVKFFGFGTVPNGTARLAFFTNGEDVYVVIEGDVLLNRFRILKVGNASLEYQELSSGLRGTAPLEEQLTAPSA